MLIETSPALRPARPATTRAGRLADAALVLGYALVVLAVIPFHEPWRDEAQSWLIARDLPLGGVLRQMGYEGTPALWHLLQMPLAKAGLPFAALQVLNALCGIGAAALIAFASPFRRWQKAVLIFSYALLAEYGVVARYYGLAVLLLFAVAALYRTRRVRPLPYAACVALVANLSVQTAGLALLLLGAFALDAQRARDRRPRALAAGALMLAAVALAAWQLRPPPDVFSKGLFPEFHPGELLRTLRAVYFAGSGLPSFLGSTLALAGFALLLRDFRPRRDVLALTLLTLAGWLYVFVFKYHASFRHRALFAAVLVAGYWIVRDGTPRLLVPLRHRWPHRRWPAWCAGLAAGEAALFAAFALSVPQTASSVAREVRRPFSNAEAMAAYIRGQRIDAPIAVYKSPHASGLLPFLPGRRWLSIEDGLPRTYLTWTPDFDWHSNLSPEVAALRARRLWPARTPWLLLNKPLRAPGPLGFRLVYHTPGRPFRELSENFWLYAPLWDGGLAPPARLARR